MTRAEQLFERFCSKNGIKATAIPTGGRKTPDYRLSINGQEVIAEVKQLDPNDEEKADLAKFDEGKAGGYSSVPGDRVRRELSKANSQLATIAKGRYPAMVVVYNNVFLRFHTDPYNIRVGMYGMEQVVVAMNPPGDLSSPQLIVYHNIYARHPLSPDLLRPYGILQFKLPEGSPHASRDWVAA